MDAVNGVIVKGIGGFYYVDTGERVYQCKARGVFRKEGKTPLVGDRVTIEVQQDGDAWITEIRKRRNAFVRPPVANVEVLALVVAAARPDPTWLMIDRFLVMAEEKHAEILLIVNKTDLSAEKAEELRRVYAPIYPVFLISAGKEDETVPSGDMDALKVALKGKIVALTGPSGVGKSTLVNCLAGLKQAETGQISERLGRGKQTTRHAELFRLSEENGFDTPTYLFDTPGFTSLDLEETGTLELEERELAYCFPEFTPHLGQCRFDNCLHDREPGCRMRQLAEEGQISDSRLESYGIILKELKNRQRF